MDEAPKNLRDGRYAIVRLLGEGAQGATFEAVDKKEGQPVAIKRFRVRGAKSWKEVELAEREARVLSGLSHPLLPRYVEHFEENGELFLVTERIEGESVAALKKGGTSLGEADVVRFLKDASSILDYLHGRAPPVVHRDIKPSNVLRRKKDGAFAIIDFGAVRDKMKPEGGSTVVGTFGYMAPEQFQGRAMPASDVYAVGATALAMLTGREPEDLPHKGLALDVAASLGSTANPALVRALAAMLEPDPDKRAARIAPLLEGLGSTTNDRRGRAAEPPKIDFSDVGKERRGQRAAAFAQKLEKNLDRGIEEAMHTLDEGFAEFDKQWARQEEKWSHKLDKKAAKGVQRAAERAARHAEKEAKRTAKHEEREAKQQARIEARIAQRAEARAHAGPIPPFVLALLLLGLTVGQVAVTVALYAFVPALLMLLSVVFGKGMRTAARATYHAGKHATAAMERAKVHLRSRGEGSEIKAQPVEQAPPPPPRVRIGADAKTPTVDEDLDALAEEEAREAEARDRKARRS